MDFKDLKLHLWLISKTIKTKTKKRNNSMVLIKHFTVKKNKKRGTNLLLIMGREKTD